VGDSLTCLRPSGPGAWQLRPGPRLLGHAARRKLPLAGILAGGLGLTIAFGIARDVRAHDEVASAHRSPSTLASSEKVRHPREKTYLKREWGVEVLDVRQTAAGHMLEFRYRVVEAEKARPLFERRTKPVLTHAESGAKLVVPTPPTTGALRSSNLPIAGRIYWMFFANPGGMVTPGQHVNIEIGEFRVDGLVVR